MGRLGALLMVMAMSIVITGASSADKKHLSPLLPPPPRKRHHLHDKSRYTLDNVRTNGAKITVASVQYPPVTGASPASSIAHNAASILSIAVTASQSSATTASPLELISFPEFALFGNQDIDSLCANETAKSTLMAPYCEILPPVGTIVDCSAPDATTSPYKIIACGLLTSSNPQTKNLLVSYNTCQNNVNSTTPSFYNTQVIVGGGKVVAIYHKFHPFITSCFDTPPLQLVTFNTLLSNVTFGVFTCFDIMFSSPKDDLVHMGVKYFSYSAAIPLVFKAAVQLFSSMNNVTVAASNLNGEASIIVDGNSVGTSCPMTVNEPCIAIATLSLS